MVYRLIGRYLPILFIPVLVIACVNVLACHFLRFHRIIAGKIYAYPGIRQYLDLVCRATGEQSPIEHADRPEDRELLISTADEFADAKERVKTVVKGQDDAIDIVLTRLQETISLRRRRASGVAVQPPLGAFLLAGPDGIGKKYFARAVAKLIYRRAGTQLISVPLLGSDPTGALFGSANSPSELLHAVRRNPFQVVLIEHIDSASDDLGSRLGELIAEGAAYDAHSKRTVSFQHTIVFLTISKGFAGLTALAEKSLAKKAWHRQAIEVLSTESSLDPKILGGLTEVVLCPPPSDMVRAEVIAMLMKREAAKYNIDLNWIDPEIIVAEVGLLQSDTGFGLLPSRVQKLLHEPLVAAANQGRNEMSLRRRARTPPPNTMPQHHEQSQ